MWQLPHMYLSGDLNLKVRSVSESVSHTSISIAPEFHVTIM
jgi:hypothetical protein